MTQLSGGWTLAGWVGDVVSAPARIVEKGAKAVGGPVGDLVGTVAGFVGDTVETVVGGGAAVVERMAKEPAKFLKDPDTWGRFVGAATLCAASGGAGCGAVFIALATEEATRRARDIGVSEFERMAEAEKKRAILALAAVAGGQAPVERGVKAVAEAAGRSNELKAAVREAQRSRAAALVERSIAAPVALVERLGGEAQGKRARQVAITRILTETRAGKNEAQAINAAVQQVMKVAVQVGTLAASKAGSGPLMAAAAVLAKDAKQLQSIRESVGVTAINAARKGQANAAAAGNAAVVAKTAQLTGSIAVAIVGLRRPLTSTADITSAQTRAEAAVLRPDAERLYLDAVKLGEAAIKADAASQWSDTAAIKAARAEFQTKLKTLADSGPKPTPEQVAAVAAGQQLPVGEPAVGRLARAKRWAKAHPVKAAASGVGVAGGLTGLVFALRGR